MGRVEVGVPHGMGAGGWGVGGVGKSGVGLMVGTLVPGPMAVWRFCC